MSHLADRDAAPERHGVNRVLGLTDTTCIVIGAIIGVGIFFNPSRVAAVAGSADMALLAWTVGGVIALAGAFTFAALGRAYHGPGAQYEILRDAYGPLPAFLFVFCNATATQAGATAVIAIVCAENVALTIRGELLSPAATLAIAAALIGGITIANVVGVRWGARIQNLTVFTKVAVLAAIIVMAFFAPHRGASDRPPGSTAPSTDGQAAAPATSPAPAPTTQSGAAPEGRPDSASPFSMLAVLFAAVVPCLFSYGGWQHALWISGEVARPQRNIPLAILVGVGIVVAVYVAANWAYLHLLGHAAVANAKTLAADAVAVVFPGGGRWLVAAGVSISSLGVLNAQLLSGPRLVQRMADDGRFFRRFAAVSPRFATPVAAILLLAVLALVLLFTAGKDGSDKLVTGVVFVDSVFFVLTGWAIFELRRRLPPDRRPPRTFLHPLFPAIFVIGEIGLLLGAFKDPAVRTAALIGAAWIVAALALYIICFRTARPSSPLV